MDWASCEAQDIVVGVGLRTVMATQGVGRAIVHVNRHICLNVVSCQ
jgi:hypothetical protein